MKWTEDPRTWQKDTTQGKEGRAMKCPLLLPIIFQLGGLPDGDEDECKKEDCAWWNSHTGECVTISIGRILNSMSDYIYGIGEKMPHAGQFTK